MHSLLLSMAADAEQLLGVARRVRQLRDEKERRAGKKVSQETVAFAVGVSPRTYRTWEKVGADIKIENLKSLAEYHGVDMDYIRYGPPPEAEEPLPTPDMSLPTDGAVLERLASIEAKLDRLVTPTSVDPSRIDQMTMEELLDAARVAIRVIEAASGRLGRDIGRRDLQARHARGPSTAPREGVA